MKTLLATVALLFMGLHLSAQEVGYSIATNLFYYPGTNQGSQACNLDVYYPKNLKKFPTVVWFHGGGLTGGAKEIPEGLKNNKMAIVGVNYRLSPQVKCPVYIEDAAVAVAWTFKNIEKFGGDTNLIFVSGHSAGGYLSSMVCLDKHWLAKYNIDANHLAGVVPLSGQAITHFTIRKERGIPETQPVIDTFAPLYHVRADAPPFLLITGDREQELLGRYEENAYLYRMMKLVGHKDIKIYELDGYDHGGMVEPALPLLIKFVNQHSKR